MQPISFSENHLEIYFLLLCVDEQIALFTAMFDWHSSNLFHHTP